MTIKTFLNKYNSTAKEVSGCSEIKLLESFKAEKQQTATDGVVHLIIQMDDNNDIVAITLIANGKSAHAEQIVIDIALLIDSLTGLSRRVRNATMSKLGLYDSTFANGKVVKMSSAIKSKVWTQENLLFFQLLLKGEST